MVRESSADFERSQVAAVQDLANLRPFLVGEGPAFEHVWAKCYMCKGPGPPEVAIRLETLSSQTDC